MNRFSKILRICLTFITFISVISFLTLNAKAASGTMDDFVERCYTVTLGRGSDAEGFAYWKGRLLNGEAVGIEVAYGFLFSKEYIGQNKSNEEYVKDLYMLFMGREPDEDGYNDWLGQLDGGKSRLEVFAGFANSQEFYNICESYGITSGRYVIGFDRTQINNVNLFVERLYRVCLGRNGDIGGQSYWVEKLINKQINGSECARSFIQSSEYEWLGLSDADYVENLYIALMGRNSEEEGKAYWLNELASGKTRDDVFAGFVNSVEFGEICNSYNIDRGTYTAQNVSNFNTNNKPKNTYDVIFNPNGGEGGMNDICAEKDISFVIPSNQFRKDDYDFIGWNTKPDGKGVAYSPGINVKNISSVGESITLYAQWKRQTYTIHFISNGGFGNMFDQTVNRGESALLTNNAFSRNDYDFVEWNTDSDGNGTSFAIDAKVYNIGLSGETVVLYAQWKNKTYTVHYESNGGSGIMPDQIINRGENTLLTYNVFSRNNYDFDGWNTDPNGNGTPFATVANVYNLAGDGSTVTLYAQWKKQTYTVHYESNGGSGIMPDQIIYRGENTLLTYNVFSRNNYDFDGWNTDPNGNGASYSVDVYVNNIASPGTKVTLYAKWKRKTYTVRFDANGGSGSMSDQIVNSNEYTILNSNQFSRESCNFIGWNTKADGTGDPYDNSTNIYNLANKYETVILYAQWQKKQYTVHFDSNGGSGFMSDMIVGIEDKARLTKNAYSFSGKTFVIWNTEPDGMGTYYSDEQFIEKLASDGETVILYAQYISPNYTIHFDSNGGFQTMDDFICDRYTSTKLNKSLYRRENYCFVGWNTQPDGSGDFYENCETVTNIAPYFDEITLYAQWKYITAWFRIDYERNGGKFKPNYNISDDYQWIKLNTPEALRECIYEREGYKFVGWNSKPDGSGVPYEDCEIVYNVSGDYDTPDLFAQWELIQ